MRKHIILAPAALALLAAGCTDSIGDTPELDSRPGVELPSGQSVDPDRIFGVWEASSSVGNTASTHFTQRYEINFQQVEEGSALVSHWFTDGETESPDSLINLEYSYRVDGTEIRLEPQAAAKARGARAFAGVNLGDDRIFLYSRIQDRTDSICTIVRIGDPQPMITSVDRTLPIAGQKVTLSGINLQFVDHLFLPLPDGTEYEVAEFSITSKAISFIMPEGEFAPGSIRAHSTTAHVSCFSPAYMFCRPCVFFHDFSVHGKMAPYEGTEFEYTINDLGNRLSKAYVCSSDEIPEGHSLYGVDIQNPEIFLTLFGETPSPWETAASTNKFDSYIRFSSGDRFQYVIDNSGDLVAKNSKCRDLALQIDIYANSDGEPVWNTGYLSWRLNKDFNSLTSPMLANVAAWDRQTPCSFADGWKTYTIPLSSFPVCDNPSMTIGQLVGTLLSGNMQTILTLVNYPLSAMHPCRELQAFQFCMADIRLVPLNTPANVKE